MTYLFVLRLFLHKGLEISFENSYKIIIILFYEFLYIFKTSLYNITTFHKVYIPHTVRIWKYCLKKVIPFWTKDIEINIPWFLFWNWVRPTDNKNLLDTTLVWFPPLSLRYFCGQLETRRGLFFSKGC